VKNRHPRAQRVAIIIMLVFVSLMAITCARAYLAARSGIARDAKGSGSSGFLESGFVMVLRGGYATVVDDAIANRLEERPGRHV